MKSLGIAPIGENDVIALVSLKGGKPFLEALEWVGGTFCSKIEGMHRHHALLRIASIDPSSLLIHSISIPSLAPWQIHKVARYQMKNHWPTLSNQWKTAYFTEKKGGETLLWIMAATRIPFSKIGVDHFISPFFSLLSFASFYFEKEKEMVMIHFYEKNGLMLLIRDQKITKHLLFDFEEQKLKVLLWRGIKILADPDHKRASPLPLLLTGAKHCLEESLQKELLGHFTFPLSFLKTEDPFVMKGALAIGNALYGIKGGPSFVHFSGWRISLPTIAFLERAKKRFCAAMLLVLVVSGCAIWLKVERSHHQLREKIYALLHSDLPLHPALKERITLELENPKGLEKATDALRSISRALISLEKKRPPLNKKGPVWEKIKILLEKAHKSDGTRLCEYTLDGNDLTLTWTCNEGTFLFYDEFCKSSLCTEEEKPSLEVDGTKATLRCTLHPSKKGF